LAASCPGASIPDAPGRATPLAGLGAVRRSGSRGGGALVCRRGRARAGVRDGVPVESERGPVPAAVHPPGALVVLSAHPVRSDPSLVVTPAATRLLPLQPGSAAGRSADSRARLLPPDRRLVSALLFGRGLQAALLYRAGLRPVESALRDQLGGDPV